MPSRQRALKALDERLSKVEQPLGWPSMDDAGTSSQDELVSPPKQVSSSSSSRGGGRGLPEGGRGLPGSGWGLPEVGVACQGWEEPVSR